MDKLVRNLSTIGKLLKPSGHKKYIAKKVLYSILESKARQARRKKANHFDIDIHINFPLQDPIKLKNSYNGPDHNEKSNEIYISCMAL